jgi:arachidonate 5-lipoxygenase
VAIILFKLLGFEEFDDLKYICKDLQKKITFQHLYFVCLVNIFLKCFRLAVAKLVSEGGWVDDCMTIGRSGMFNIIKANWKELDWSKCGNILKDFEFRGVDDKQALPNYHYRDDSTLLWHAIYKYVSNVMNAYYG